MILNNKNTTIDDFNNARDAIVSKYNFDRNKIKAIFVKKLPNSDVLTANKPASAGGNTTHIACTTQSKHFFYPILGDIAFNKGLSPSSTFDINVETLYTDTDSHYTGSISDSFVKSECTIWKFPKSDNDQIGLSKLQYDGPDFYKLREAMYPNDVIIFFKYITDENVLENYIILLKHDDEEDKNLIDNIVGIIPPSSFAKYYEEIAASFDYDPNLVGINKIYYGAPGTGKSNHVNNTYYNVNPQLAKRVTFHPEYTYNDFIGYIRPVDEDDNLTYKFIPGTFTEILTQALNDPSNMYSLIIEELNRANTAAVFGDLFQLLDRTSDGVSEYKVNNPEIYKYIKDELKDKYIFEDGSIYIPNNLNIIATMNTADQNIFPMDTAFKRRWEFEYLAIEFKNDHSFADENISAFGLENITWKSFVTTVNSHMMSKENSDLMISEDKQIGQYFIKKEELTDASKFGYKVLLYLWDDVFKMDRESMFNSRIRTFSELIEGFTTLNALDIFSPNVVEKLKASKQEEE